MGLSQSKVTNIPQACIYKLQMINKGVNSVYIWIANKNVKKASVRHTIHNPKSSYASSKSLIRNEIEVYWTVIEAIYSEKVHIFFIRIQTQPNYSR